jgi:hypothetical protein
LGVVCADPALAEGFAGARLRVIEGSGHLVDIGAPGVGIEVVRDHLLAGPTIAERRAPGFR